MKKLSVLMTLLALMASGVAPASADSEYEVDQKTLASFSSSATSLSAQQKTQIRATVEANPEAEKFICTGIRYYSQPMSVNVMVRKRAKEACAYAKQLNPALSTWFQNKPTQARSYAGKVLLTVKTAKEKAFQIKIEPQSNSVQQEIFSLASASLSESETLRTLCLTVDKEIATNQLFPSLTFETSRLFLDADGCITFSGDFSSDSILTSVIATKTLSDGNHELTAVGSVEQDDNSTTSIETTISFLTNNFSLRATAPQPVLTGSYSAGATLRVSPGSWGQGVTFSYEWYLDDVLVLGANSESYLLTQADVGKKLRAEVTGKKSDNDFATRMVETTAPIVEEQTFPASQGSIANTSASFQVQESKSVYNSTTRSFDDVIVNDYRVAVSYPASVVCGRGTGYFYSCSFDASASWGGLFDTYEYFIETVSLVRVSDGTRVSSSSVYLSKLSNQESDDLRFSVSASSLSSNPSENQFRVEISEAGYGQTLTSLGSGVVTLIKEGTASTAPLNFSATNPAITASRTGSVYQGGTASSPQWTLWQYATPTTVKALEPCVVLPIYLAPQSIVNGSLSDRTTQQSADATLSILDSDGSLRDKISINGYRGHWTNLVSGNRVDVKVCGLEVREGVRETLQLKADLSYDAYDFDVTYVFTETIEVVGALKFSRINCFNGEEGIVVDAHKPSCPEGWTQTNAPVINGKVKMTTLNCLKGTDVVVVTAPEAKCPAGYSVTKLKVKDGKLVPWTIKCTRGLSVRTVTGVFPKCPAGYSAS